MKKLIYVFGFAIAFISCKQEAPIDYAIISGNILNKDVGELTLNSMDRSFMDTLHVAENGNFVDTLKVKTGTYMLYDGKNLSKVYIDIGNKINISYDAADFKNTLTFSGIGSEVSSYLVSKQNKEKEIRGDGGKVFKLEEADFKAKYNEIKTALNELLSSTVGISEAYKTKERRNLNYAYLSKLRVYESYHARDIKIPDFKVSDGFLNDFEGLILDNEVDFFFSPSYKSLVNAHYRKEAEKLSKSDSIATNIAFLKAVGTVHNKVIKNNLLFNYAKYGITYTGELEPFYSVFMNLSSNKDHKKEITESYNKLKTVAKGQPSPKFINYENHAGGTISLDDLKGKYVYVDVWATWCGPCKREIPYLKEVEKKYHDKNIEFVSISVDRPKAYEAWRKMVTDKTLGGIQLYADNAFQSDFVQGYLIKGIPRFILIDPDGNIVNSNAPRPSDQKLRELFNTLKI